MLRGVGGCMSVQWQHSSVVPVHQEWHETSHDATQGSPDLCLVQQLPVHPLSYACLVAS